MGTISLWVVLAILLIHWIADFILQTDEEAKGKSSSWRCLLSHTLTYSFVFFIASLMYGAVDYNVRFLLFSPITFIAHTATDYYTSRVNAQLWKEQRTHAFFVSVGFDQLLHFAQLLITFQLLTK